MSTFKGRYYYSLDPKGRVIIPAPFRDTISSSYSPVLVVTISFIDKCLVVYPLEVWKKHETQVLSLPKTEEAVQRYMRKVIGSAVEVPFDKQGRIQVPVSLRQEAEVNSDLVIVGQLEYVEIWDKANWDKANVISDADAREHLKTLSRLGL